MNDAHTQDPVAWFVLGRIGIATDSGAWFFRRGEVVDDAQLAREIVLSGQEDRLRPLSREELESLSGGF